MFDLLIRGSTGADGIGPLGRMDDVGVRDGRIEAVGALPGARKRRRTVD